MRLVPITVSLLPETITKIDRLASKSNRRRADYLRGLIESALEDAPHPIESNIVDVNQIIAHAIEECRSDCPRREKKRIAEPRIESNPVQSKDDDELRFEALQLISESFGQSQEPRPKSIADALGISPQKLSALLKPVGISSVGKYHAARYPLALREKILELIRQQPP